MLQGCNRYFSIIGWLALILFIAIGFACPASASDLSKYAISDVKVLYLFEDPKEIDWPTIYYLNDEYGCRVDLVTLKERSNYEITDDKIEDKQINLYNIFLSDTDSLTLDKAIGDLFEDRYPDVVLFDEESNKPMYTVFKKRLESITPPPGQLFSIQKIFKRIDESHKTEKNKTVVLNSEELYNRYKDRIKLEVPILFPNHAAFNNTYSHLTKYLLIMDKIGKRGSGNEFLNGISTFRLMTIIDSLLTEGPMKRTILDQAKKFSSYFNAARVAMGKQKVDFVVDGYRELLYLRQHERVQSQYPAYRAYLNNIFKRAERAALDLVGINWEGKIILRDSPHGPKLKFRAAVSVDGPKEVTINNFYFHPYWDSVDVKLADAPVNIEPHQTYMREFLVDIDRKYLEAERPDSLKFSVQIAYGQIPLVFTNTLPVWVAPALKIKLEPDFYFVKPFPEIDIDRVVTSLNLKVIITKPYDYSGTADINFQTPVGMYAGAYRKEIQLDKGSITETIRIPFTISNLFELGAQLETVELLVNKMVVAADTGRIRIASCKIPDTRKIGFLPDSSGMLEDVLSMTDAAYRPLTDRTLVKGDLDAYDVIVIGSDAYKNYPSFTYLKDRFEQYVRDGGSLVIFPQSEDWPNSAIPLSFVPTVEVVDKSMITNRIKEANILSRPYTISDKNLLSSFYKKTEVRSAVVAPSERVFVTPSGATLLSVSRIGDGQIIYCGFPILQMVASLDIEAIHLFANIMNY